MTEPLNQDEEGNNNERIKALAADRRLKLQVTEKNEWRHIISWFFLTDVIKKKIRGEIQKKMKRLDILIILLSGIGLLTNGGQSGFYLKFTIVSKDNNTKSISIEGKSQTKVEILRLITTCTTGIVLILIVIHYRMRKTLLIFKQQVELNSSLWSTGLFIPMVIEMLINVVHTPPYMNNVMINISTTDTESIVVPVDGDLFFSVFVPFRVYLGFKFYAFYSKWGDDRAERVCKESNAEGGVGFALKAEIRDRPYFVVFFLMISSILLFGYCGRNTELPFMIDMPGNGFQDWTLLWNGFWCIIITIFTVGYGDYYPKTHFGRAITIIACLWGTFLVSGMVVAITNSMDFTPQQLNAYNELEHWGLEQQFKKKALMLIRYYYHAKSLNESSDKGHDPELEAKQTESFNKSVKKLRKAGLDFRKMRKKIKELDNTTTIEALVGKINKSLNDSMDTLVRTSKIQVNNLLEHIRYSKNYQEMMKVYVNTLDSMTARLLKKIEKPYQIKCDNIVLSSNSNTNLEMDKWKNDGE